MFGVRYQISVDTEVSIFEYGTTHNTQEWVKNSAQLGTINKFASWE